jgi:hypothetical protein
LPRVRRADSFGAPVAVGGVALSVGSFALDRVADAVTKEAAPLAALFAPDERSLPFKDLERPR